MGADRRVEKSKKQLKGSLTQLLTCKSFESITVTELCRHAHISRITFYSHYDDKVALGDELMEDMLAIAKEDYYGLQRDNNPEDNLVRTFCNMLESIINLYTNNLSLFAHTTVDKNPYLYYVFFSYIQRHVETVVRHRQDKLRLKYPPRQISAFICNGLWGFINEAAAPGESPRAIGAAARRLLIGMLESRMLLEEL